MGEPSWFGVSYKYPLMRERNPSLRLNLMWPIGKGRNIKTRLSKLNIDKEKKNLAKLEQRLDKIISPELRAEMELAAIQKELDD